MKPLEIFVDNKPILVGRKVGKGGEGEVYAVGTDERYAVKIYTTSDLPAKESKISAMVDAHLANQAELVAFPISIARNKAGSFLGFVMRLVNEHRPLHELYAPGSRKLHFPQADYRFIVRAAANFARAIAAVHDSGCVVGDINHSGILVSKKATVTLIDADSFQFSRAGLDFLCKVGVPEYTPPELQGLSLATARRTVNHDAFGLAIVIFQLLFMGRHPFVGTVRSGDIPPLHENIKNFRYVYSDSMNVGMDQPPGTPALNDFSPTLSALFDKAFLRPSLLERPQAKTWVHELEKLETSLTQCSSNSLHYYPRDSSGCAWCDMDREIGTTLFVPYVPNVNFVDASFDPGAGGFNLDAIWAAIELIIKSTPSEFSPGLASSSVAPSQEAIAAKASGTSIKNIVGYAIVFACVVGFFAAPPAFIIWLILGGYGVSLSQEKSEVDSERFVQNYQKSFNRMQVALQDWEKRSGFAEYINYKNELLRLKTEYLGLASEESNQISRYKANRRQLQLTHFLDQFDIQNAHLNGIGPAKEALLSSYGVDTAADVTVNKLMSIPGIGEVTAKVLTEWRSKLEKRFLFQSYENEKDKQEIARIRGMVEAKASPIRRKLTVAAANLRLLAERAKSSVRAVNATVVDIQRSLDQAKADLDYLGVAIPLRVTPSVAANAPAVNRVPANQTTKTNRTPSSSSPHASQPNCPRCGGSMIKRLAKRGRNAGNYFWGCSRYPRCKGTKNI